MKSSYKAIIVKLVGCYKNVLLSKQVWDLEQPGHNSSLVCKVNAFMKKVFLWSLTNIIVIVYLFKIFFVDSGKLIIVIYVLINF